MKKIKNFRNLIIVVASILLFVILRLIFGGNIFIYLAGVLCGFGAYSAFSYVEDKKQQQIESSYEYQIEKLIEQLESLAGEHYIFEDVVSDFRYRVNSFADKDSSLIQLIRVNDNNKKTYLQNCINVTHGYIISNAKKLIKTLIAYSAQTSRPKRVEDVKAVKDVFKSLDDLAINYDKLLDEVVRLGDDFNPEDPGLKDVVENLQELRSSSNADEANEDEYVEQPIALNVTHSK